MQLISIDKGEKKYSKSENSALERVTLKISPPSPRGCGQTRLVAVTGRALLVLLQEFTPC